MKNIIIYNSEGKSKLESLLLKGADYSVIAKKLEEIKLAESLNPDMIILEGKPEVIEDVLVRNKVSVPLLIASDKILDIRVRAADSC